MPPKKAAYGKAAKVASGAVLRDSFKHSWTLQQHLATGGFGHVYVAKPMDGTKFAGEYVVKVEPRQNGPLYTEIHIYQAIGKQDKMQSYMKEHKLLHLAVPPFVGAGVFTNKQDECRFLVMPRYAQDIDHAREQLGGSLSALAVCNVVRQCVQALQYLHSCDVVHADIKGENLLLVHKVHPLTQTKLASAHFSLTDYGLAKRLSADPEEKEDKKRAHNGTLQFTSLDAHRGCAPSYRADLEILAYNMLYWLTGTLKWFNKTSPDVVFADKRAFKDKCEANVKAALKECKADTNTVNALVLMFACAYDCDYSNRPDYAAVHKALTKMAGSKSSTASSNKSVAKRSRKSVQAQEEDEPEVIEHEEQAAASSSARPVRKSKSTAAKSTKSASNEEWEEDWSSEDELPPTPPKYKGGARAHGQVNGQSTSHSRRRKAGTSPVNGTANDASAAAGSSAKVARIVPGLANMRVVQRANGAASKFTPLQADANSKNTDQKRKANPKKRAAKVATVTAVTQTSPGMWSSSD